MSTKLTRVGTVALARKQARRRLPRAVFDYLDGGAETETTMQANRTAFEEIGFRPRMGVATDAPALTTTVIDIPVTMPLLLSPMGFMRVMHPAGDIAAAAAAASAGTIFTLSSMSGHRIDQVAAASAMPPWFQLYFIGGRSGAEQLVDRADRSSTLR